MTSSHMHLLVRAAIVHDGHLLLARARGHAFTFLPGGHVEKGEALRAALRRELHEETGVWFEVRDFLGVVEHAWTDDQGQRQFELNHVFVAGSPPVTSDQAVSSREGHLTFEWAPLADLTRHALEPAPLRALLKGGADRAFFASTVERTSI